LPKIIIFHTFTKKKFMKNTFWDRFFEQTPKYWKKIRNFAASIGAASGAVLAANELSSLSLGDGLISVLQHAVVVGIFVAALAQNTSVKR
jgi:predicted membrane-bound spermidine synthase